MCYEEHWVIRMSDRNPSESDGVQGQFERRRSPRKIFGLISLIFVLELYKMGPSLTQTSPIKFFSGFVGLEKILTDSFGLKTGPSDSLILTIFLGPSLIGFRHFFVNLYIWPILPNIMWLCNLKSPPASLGSTLYYYCSCCSQRYCCVLRLSRHCWSNYLLVI